ncbi:hypothetical protein ABK040_010264 [Willaertia magna]
MYNYKRKSQISNTPATNHTTKSFQHYNPQQHLSKQNSSKQAIIVHQRMSQQVIRQELSNHYNITNTTSQIADIIFPSLRLAFLIVDIANIYDDITATTNNNLNNQNTMSQVIKDMNALGSTFERSFVIVLIQNKAFFGKLFQLQQQATIQTVEYQTMIEGAERRNQIEEINQLTTPMFRSPQIIPCSSMQTAVKCILELSKIENRKERVKQQENEFRAVSCSALQIGSTILFNALHNHTNITEHDANVLLQGMGSIANVVQAKSIKEIMERTPLERKKAAQIYQYFNSQEE